MTTQPPADPRAFHRDSLVFDGLTPSIIDAWRAERMDAAEQARGAFEQSARRAGLQTDTRVIAASTAGAADIISTIDVLTDCELIDHYFSSTTVAGE